MRRSRSLSPLRLMCFTRVSFKSSASDVHRPLINIGFSDSPEFELDISHWANSSSQVPVCSVEPGAPNDVAKIVIWSLC